MHADIHALDNKSTCSFKLQQCPMGWYLGPCSLQSHWIFLSMQSGSKARYRASSLQISKTSINIDQWFMTFIFFVHVRLDGIDGKRDVPALRQDLCTQYTACTYIHTYFCRYLLQTLDFTTPPNEWWDNLSILSYYDGRDRDRRYIYAALWGLIFPSVGTYQERLLPHWVIGRLYSVCIDHDSCEDALRIYERTYGAWCLIISKHNEIVFTG